MKILGTGLSGLVGSRVVELLSPQYSFENLSLETGIDITKKELVDNYINNSDAPWVFHFAGATDVDGCEKDRNLGEQSVAWRVNVAATGFIAEACKRTGKKLLYISTDFVFDGTKDEYHEEDEPHPLSWYAITKYEGEKRVEILDSQSIIIRITAPYCANNPAKADFVHRIISTLSKHESIASPTDQIFVPTFIDDIATAIKTLVESKASGVYHVVGSQALSPYESSVKIARTFGLDTDLIKESTFAEYFKDRAPRPFRLFTKNDKISGLGVKMSGFEEGLELIKKEI